MKGHHPIRYFLADTIPYFIRYKVWFPLTRPIKNVYYWFISHVVPSRQYHMLNLRQSGEYRYGWRNVSEKMLYAKQN